MGTQPPIPQKGAQPPPIFGQCLLWANGRPSQLPLSSCSSSHVRRHLRAVSSWALGKLHWTDVVMVMTLHVGWLEFNVPFQHKYSYIRDEITLQSQGKGNIATFFKTYVMMTVCRVWRMIIRTVPWCVCMPSDMYTHTHIWSVLTGTWLPF